MEDREEKDEKVKENQINNTYQILAEFKQRSGRYIPPTKPKCMSNYHGRSGKVRILNKEELIVCRMKEVGKYVKFEV